MGNLIKRDDLSLHLQITLSAHTSIPSVSSAAYNISDYEGFTFISYYCNLFLLAPSLSSFISRRCVIRILPLNAGCSGLRRELTIDRRRPGTSVGDSERSRSKPELKGRHVVVRLFSLQIGRPLFAVNQYVASDRLTAAMEDVPQGDKTVTNDNKIMEYIEKKYSYM
ncbi:hypothetical protein OUZ56_031076 [Daphnia magna]|uniref:Uncharacterized protein n=1 Tax=Daphnia magna TaxID=35525 RepID=A0ABQ9ZTJ2_9CRUS|nr:hypothetical protein OUZ56_031076 [Daphnia magna]